MSPIRVRTITCLFLVAACGGVGEPDIEGKPLGGSFQCPPAYCGSNSAVIDHYGFHELNLDGIANHEGFRVLGMSSGPDFYRLEVVKGRISGHYPKRAALSGQALVGARIYLEHTNGLQYAITIADVGYVDEVVYPHNKLETYRFEWAVITKDQLPNPVKAGDVLPIPSFDQPQDVCPVEKIEEAAEWDEARKMPPVHALVYEGDRIEMSDRTVDPTFDPRWFNVTCGHDTLVKLRLTRSTLAATKNWRLVQATLKMLSADYCGTGTSFTMTGEPLVWRSLSGMEMRGSPTSFEARWDEKGARCLDLPRAAKTPLYQLAAAFPDIEGAIANECQRPPPCANPDPTIYEPDDLVISGNVDP